MQVGMPSVNPNGRPSGIIHTLKDRQNHFLETLTRGEILALAVDEQRLNHEYRAFDAQVILGLAETLLATPEGKLDPRAARNDLYDRNLGKASQPIDAAVKVTHEVDNAQLARQLAFIMAEQDAQGIVIDGNSTPVLVDAAGNEAVEESPAQPDTP